jgi:hypothetical protein
MIASRSGRGPRAPVAPRRPRTWPSDSLAAKVSPQSRYPTRPRRVTRFVAHRPVAESHYGYWLPVRLHASRRPSLRGEPSWPIVKEPPRGIEPRTYALREPLPGFNLALTSHFACTITPSRPLQPPQVTPVRSTSGSTHCRTPQAGLDCRCASIALTAGLRIAASKPCPNDPSASAHPFSPPPRSRPADPMCRSASRMPSSC